MGVNRHLVLLDKTADAGNLGHALGLGQLITDEPVLQSAQFGQRKITPEYRVLVHPTHARGIRPQLRTHTTRQAARRKVEVFQHTRTRPVNVSAVLENHIDERRAKEREPPYHLGSRHTQHSRRQGISDLILHHLRGLSWIFGVDDDLDVGQIRQRVHRHFQ